MRNASSKTTRSVLDPTSYEQARSAQPNFGDMHLAKTPQNAEQEGASKPMKIKEGRRCA